MASGMLGWIEAHPDIALAGGAVGVLLIAGSLFKSKTPTTGTGTTQDLSGLQNGIVYVPTQTSFTTNNRTQSGVFASNDPLLTGVTTGPVNSPTTTTTTTKTTTGGTTTTYPPPQPPTRTQPPPGPNPPPTGGKSLRWDASYTVLGGDNLSAIAARLNPKLRAQGMPGSMSITWSDIYAHNTAKINSYAQQHGFKSDYWNWIFPGETLVVPRWG